MIINGKEVKFSPTNKRDAANMEKALKEMQQTEEKDRNITDTALMEQPGSVQEGLFYKTHAHTHTHLQKSHYFLYKLSLLHARST